MSDAQALYSNDIVLAREIDAVRGEYGERIAELERQIKLLNNQLVAQNRRTVALTENLQGLDQFTTAAAAREAQRTAESQMQQPCQQCAS